MIKAFREFRSDLSVFRYKISVRIVDCLQNGIRGRKKIILLGNNDKLHITISNGTAKVDSIHLTRGVVKIGYGGVGYGIITAGELSTEDLVSVYEYLHGNFSQGLEVSE